MLDSLAFVVAHAVVQHAASTAHAGDALEGIAHDVGGELAGALPIPLLLVELVAVAATRPMLRCFVLLLLLLDEIHIGILENSCRQWCRRGGSRSCSCRRLLRLLLLLLLRLQAASQSRQLLSCRQSILLLQSRNRLASRIQDLSGRRLIHHRVVIIMDLFWETKKK